MNTFEASYARLQVAFKARCAGEALELRALAEARQLRSARAVALLHRLAGAAGTFGFERLSIEAAALEEAVRAPGEAPISLENFFAVIDAAAAPVEADPALRVA